MNYHVLTHDVRAAAQRLAATVEAICEQTGYERIHVIGHSMGGIIARYYVQRMGGDARVHTLVTLGSPHARHPRRAPAAAWRVPPADARAATSSPSSRSRRRAAAPGSCRSGATSTG